MKQNDIINLSILFKVTVLMLIVDQNVLDDISRGFSVPAQPKLLLQLLKLMAEPSPDVNAIVNAISKDIAVSAAILKTVNSPLYGLSRTVTDIKMSVSYIGIYGVVMLVTGSLLKKSFDPKKCSIDLDAFWNITGDIASATVAIGKKLNIPLPMDKLFSLGLFHACGIPVMAMKYDNYQSIFHDAITNTKTPLPAIEEKEYHVNHATIGYYVASSWRLPKDVCQIILQHHDRAFLDKPNESEEQFLFAILKLAENIISWHHNEQDDSDWPFVKSAVLSLLKIKEDNLPEFIADISNSL